MTLPETLSDATMTMNASTSTPSEQFSIESVRKEFPALEQLIEGQPLVYLDSAASALKPKAVISALSEFYATDYSNVHRSAHTLSTRATQRYEGARAYVQKTLNARHAHEIVFTRNATEAINLVANSWGTEMNEKSAIAVSEMEHHSNLIPWQFLSRRSGCSMVKIPITDSGEIDREAYRAVLSDRAISLVALTHISNVLGTINPIGELIAEAHRHGAIVLIDGSQGAPHEVIDVIELDADFYVFTGHKVYGPSGIGVLYGKESLLEGMPPWQGGGEMVSRVAFGSATWNDLPWKFEAGTPPIAQAIGLEAALRFMEDGIGGEALRAHERALGIAAREQLGEIEGLRLLGPMEFRAPIFSFVLEGQSSLDVVELLDSLGICCRAGLHCAEPLLMRLGIRGCARASFGVYNSEGEIRHLCNSLRRVKQMLV